MVGIFFHCCREYIRVAAVLAGLVAGGPAWGQVNLPRVPDSPAVGGLLGQVERETDRLARDPAGRLHDARRKLLAELLRRNRAELERGPRGEAIVRGEVTAYSPSAALLVDAQEAGFVIAREVALGGLDARVVVLQAPPGWSTRRALRQLQGMDPEGDFDFNHIYLPVGLARSADSGGAQAPEVRERAGSTARVGLVDGGIAPEHPAFRGATIHTHGCDGTVVPSAHGTAVASLLVGQSEEFQGAAPGGTLYAADIYCGRATGGAADAFASALAWLADERVAVINTSIVGPPNRILERVVRDLSDRGHAIVAAVGNDGPAARPLFPAAYPATVGVTGVRATRRVLPEAGRGPHVDFAAPGADMLAAGVGSPFAEVRGTSYAAPLVAGLLAGLIDQPDPDAVREAIGSLAAAAIDLGRGGRDEVYGEGLVAESLRVVP